MREFIDSIIKNMFLWINGPDSYELPFSILRAQAQELGLSEDEFLNLLQLAQKETLGGSFPQ